MAKCEVCSKGLSFGNDVSHSNRKTSRTVKPNLQSVKINDNGTVLGTKTTDGKDYVYDQPVVNRMKPVEVEKDTTGENTTTNEPSKEPSTEPSKEEIKTRGGKVNPSL